MSGLGDRSNFSSRIGRYHWSVGRSLVATVSITHNLWHLQVETSYSSSLSVTTFLTFANLRQTNHRGQQQKKSTLIFNDLSTHKVVINHKLAINVILFKSKKRWRRGRKQQQQQ